MTDILDIHHMVRHVPPKYIDEDGDITSAAFKLNLDKDEVELSVYWPEYYAGETIFNNQVNKAKDDIRNRITVRKSHKFAIIKVGETKKYVKKESKGARELIFVHTPEDSDSHSSIYHIEPNQDEIAELIFDTVVRVDPA